jgi:hypothetical protein
MVAFKIKFVDAKLVLKMVLITKKGIKKAALFGEQL